MCLLQIIERVGGAPVRGRRRAFVADVRLEHLFEINVLMGEVPSRNTGLDGQLGYVEPTG